MALYAGIEIGGTKLQVVVGDGEERIGERHRTTVEPKQGAAGIRRQIEELLGRASNGRDLGAIGVGFGGPVDWKTGKICRSHQIEGWSEFELGDWLRQLSGAPVATDNDANVAALGEARHGAGRNLDPAFYVTLGSGVGGGLVVAGNIYHGASPGEAEIGHVRLDRDGTTVESRCSGWAVDSRIRNQIALEPDGRLAKLADDARGGEARHLAAALLEGDAAAQRILYETAMDLAFGLSHVVHLFHPRVIILGGGLAHLGEPLRNAVEESLRRYTMEAFVPSLRVVLSALGDDAVPIGALELAKGAVG